MSIVPIFPSSISPECQNQAPELEDAFENLISDTPTQASISRVVTFFKEQDALEHLFFLHKFLWDRNLDPEILETRVYPKIKGNGSEVEHNACITIKQIQINYGIRRFVMHNDFMGGERVSREARVASTEREVAELSDGIKRIRAGGRFLIGWLVSIVSATALLILFGLTLYLTRRK